MTKKTAKKKAKPAKKKVAKKASSAKKARPAKKASPAKKKSARKPNAAFMKPLNVSPALAAVIGPKAAPRTEVVKKIWDYIKKNQLQDPQNKRNILADEKLKPVFAGKGTVSMFEMTKLLSKHLS